VAVAAARPTAREIANLRPMPWPAIAIGVALALLRARTRQRAELRFHLFPFNGRPAMDIAARADCSIESTTAVVAGFVPAAPQPQGKEDHRAVRNIPGNAVGTKRSPIERAYRRCAIAFLTVFFGGVELIYTFLLVVDPWDTGRFPTPLPTGVVDIERRTATASRGRDPRFNAAIVGNSRTFTLDPEKLSKATGLSFVSLGTPGSGPREEMLVTRYFLHFHPAAEAILFSIDERWCSHDPSMPLTMAFPFWLYRDNLEYLANLLSTRAFNAAQTRIMLAMGRLTPTDPRGYLDYEAGKTWNFHPPAALPPVAVPVRAAVQANTYFPAIEAFDGLLAELPPQTRFVIMMPPVYHTGLPRPGTQDAADLLACKAALAHRLGRQGVAFLDYQVDGPISRDPRNFMDMVHYRHSVAQIIEDGIIETFDGRGGEAAGGRRPVTCLGTCVEESTD
jgi:hypothetical protein